MGEYYGFSMAAVDLQGLGYMFYMYSLLYILLLIFSMDDLLISAPMYSPEIDRPEYGRVYVYRNDQVSICCTISLVI